MGCPCTNPITGEIKIVAAKTKEMVYRMQDPHLKELIEMDKLENHTFIPPRMISGKKQ